MEVDDPSSPFYQLKYVFANDFFSTCISRQGCFVHVVGALRTGNDPYVSINRIHLITSANEIACMY